MTEEEMLLAITLLSVVRSSRDLVVIHDSNESLTPQPAETFVSAGCGAEDEIRTRATFNSATPLAGEIGRAHV